MLKYVIWAFCKQIKEATMENLSKIKRDDLIHRIEILKVKYSTDEETRFLLNDIITELTGKKYGLVWERHEESVDIQEKKVFQFSQKIKKEILFQTRVFHTTFYWKVTIYTVLNC